MTTWSLDRIRYAIRKITGQLDESQIPNSSVAGTPISLTNPPGLDDYINDFYCNDLPEHLRTLVLKTFYKFVTVPNVGTYSLPSNLTLGNQNANPVVAPSVTPVYNSVESPIYVDGYQIAYYQNPDIFYRIWPELNFIQNQIATGNGGSTYQFTLSQLPIQQGTVLIGTQNSATPGVTNEAFNDKPADGFINTALNPAFTNPGLLYSQITGATTTSSAFYAPAPNTVSSINYLNGAVIVTFTNPVPVGVKINAHYYPYVASRPRDCLFFNQQFNFKPIPNDVYNIKIMCYQQPTVVLAGGAVSNEFGNATTDLPIYNEWWQTLVYGAAIKILVELGDHEEATVNKMYFEEAKRLAQRRALHQLANQRIQTPYSDNVAGPSFPIYPFY